MPKPTFLQAVLGKPTRSYANPNGLSPWADPAPEPYYVPSQWSAGVSSAIPQRQQAWGGRTDVNSPTSEAGPSRKPRRAKSTVSVIEDETPRNAGTRFPKPVRKSVSSVVLRDTAIVTVPASTVGCTTTTTRKKKKKQVVREYDDDSITSSQPSRTSSRAPSRSRRHVVDIIDSSSNRSSPTSQTQTNERRKTRPAVTVVQRNIPPGTTSMITPPSSDMSSVTKVSLRKQARSVTPPPPVPPIIIRPVEETQAPTRSAKPNGSETEGEMPFFTPTSSVQSSPVVVLGPRPVLGAVTVFDNGPSEERNLSPHTPTSPASGLAGLGPPLFTLQPPTPAPMPDPEKSPFHPEHITPSSLLPQEHNGAVPNGIKAQDPEHEAEDSRTASSEAGSNEETQGDSPKVSKHAHSRQSSLNIPPPVPLKSPERSRQESSARSANSSIDGRQPPRSQSRQSTRSNRNSYDDFVVRRQSFVGSEASFGGRSVVRDSLRASISGTGKGGWAAAAASGSIRSGASSPVMMMPTSGSDGWADFHIPIRQSKFTPLPPSSQPVTFDRLVNGTGPGSRNGSPSLPSRDSQALDVPSGSGESSPSEYSQISDGYGNPIPKPSRSYINKDFDQETSLTEEETPRVRQFSTPQLNNYGASQQSHSRPQSVFSLPANIAPRSLSRLSMINRPASPAMSYDPETPRMGLHPPSFLNPDTLTLLPEMTEQDSSALYRPTPSESGKSRSKSRNGSPPRRSNSVLGFARSARSEVSLRDDDYEDVRQRRSKSVLGHRRSVVGNNESRWEGSSYGEGVLMESNGKVPEGLGGYTNLVLPAGAYKALNPAKAASEVDSRILGLPHSTMASITLSHSAHRNLSTPLHLRDQLPPPVDFNSHLKPPNRVSNSQLLVQVYAVAIDDVDVRFLDDKGKSDVGRWVPGRSFVGRCMMVGSDEKDIVRGDLVIGLFEIRKSGALCEYILCDRRRIARAPLTTDLTLEQMSLLPLQGIQASRAIRTHLHRQSRALIVDAHKGISALVCQEMSRAGVNVTAVIPGGQDAHQSQMGCMANGARGVLTGSAAAVMLSLDESGWDYIFDTVGGVRVYDAAKRILKEGGKLVSTCPPDVATTSLNPTITSKPSGLKTLRAAFKPRRKDVKTIVYQYLAPSGSAGEPEVDTSGVDNRDILEEDCFSHFRPVVGRIRRFEDGMDCFRGSMGKGEVQVVRVIN